MLPQRSIIRAISTPLLALFRLPLLLLLVLLLVLVLVRDALPLRRSLCDSHGAVDVLPGVDSFPTALRIGAPHRREGLAQDTQGRRPPRSSRQGHLGEYMRGVAKNKTTRIKKHLITEPSMHYYQVLQLHGSGGLTYPAVLEHLIADVAQRLLHVQGRDGPRRRQR